MELHHSLESSPPRDSDLPRLPAADRWRAILAEQAQGGLGVSAFCRQRSIPASSFFAWRRKLRRAEADAGADATAGFARVKVVPALEPALKPEPRDVGVEVRLRSGRGVRVRRGFDPALLAGVVGVLEGLA